MFSLYRNPDLDGRIHNISLPAMAAVEVRPSLLLTGDLNDQYQELLGSTSTSRHGVAAVEFVTVSGCDQLVTGPTHARGGTLDLLVTDVPDIVWVDVVHHKVVRIINHSQQPFRWHRLFLTFVLARGCL